MLRLILFLAVAIALAAVAVWLADQPGQVVVEWGGLVRTYAVGTAVALLAAIVAAAIVLFEILRWLGAVPTRWRRASRQRRAMRGYEAMVRGLIAAASGDRAAAAHHGREAARLAPQRSGTLLLEAQTAQLDGRDDDAARAFRAMLGDPTTELLGLRGLLSQAMKAGDRVEALELARRAYRLNPRTPWVLQTLFELLTRAEQWQEALGILDGLARGGHIEPTVARRRRAILLHLMAQALQREGRLAEALATERRALRADATFVPAAIAASQLALEAGRRRLARKLLETSWAAEPTPELARAWLALPPSDPPSRLYDRARRLETIRPDHVYTQLTLGEVALAGDRLAMARQHLSRAEALGGTVRVYRALAELEAREGDEEKAARWRQRATEARPDKAWVCADTGEVLPGWEPFGPTGTFDSVHWSEPPRLTRLAADGQGALLVEASATVEPLLPVTSRPPAAAQPATAAAA